MYLYLHLYDVIWLAMVYYLCIYLLIYIYIYVHTHIQEKEFQKEEERSGAVLGRCHLSFVNSDRSGPVASRANRARTSGTARCVQEGGA